MFCIVEDLNLGDPPGPEDEAMMLREQGSLESQPPTGLVTHIFSQNHLFLKEFCLDFRHIILCVI